LFHFFLEKQTQRFFCFFLNLEAFLGAYEFVGELDFEFAELFLAFEESSDVIQEMVLGCLEVAMFCPESVVDVGEVPSGLSVHDS
jgi:hypothetical protein